MHAFASHMAHFAANPGLFSHAAHGLRLMGDHAPHAGKAVAGPAGFVAGKAVQVVMRVFFI